MGHLQECSTRNWHLLRFFNIPNCAKFKTWLFQRVAKLGIFAMYRVDPDALHEHGEAVQEDQ